MTLPIIMSQNIGTCVTAVIGSAGANKDAKHFAAAKNITAFGDIGKKERNLGTEFTVPGFRSFSFTKSNLLKILRILTMPM